MSSIEFNLVVTWVIPAGIRLVKDSFYEQMLMFPGFIPKSEVSVVSK